MANKIIEQTVPRYKINGISTLTFCSTRAISNRLPYVSATRRIHL